MLYNERTNERTLRARTDLIKSVLDCNIAKDASFLDAESGATSSSPARRLHSPAGAATARCGRPPACGEMERPDAESFYMLAHERCLHRGSVVVTIATSRSYIEAAEELAASALEVGIQCILIALPTSLSGRVRWPLVELPLPPHVASWLPPLEWCRPGRIDRSGYRQTHVLKTQAMVSILRTGRDVLFVDADRRFVSDPVPALRATGADVAAIRDTDLLNVGLMWLRARGSALLHVAERVANRSYMAWDQAVFNEEVAAASGVSCCFTNSFMQHCMNLSETTHKLRVAGDAEARQAEQPGCAPAAARLHTLAPPARRGSSSAPLFRTWSAGSYNHLPMAWRRPSRCSTRPCPMVTVARGARPTCGVAAVVGADSPLVRTAPPATSEPSVAHGREPDPREVEGAALGALQLPRAAHRSAQTPFRCTAWPTPTPPGWADARRCEHGNLQLHDGFEYVHNRGRGTRDALCQGACTCCRRRRPSDARTTTQ